MTCLLRDITKPLNLAGVLTIVGVMLSFGPELPPYGQWRWTTLIAFTLLFLLRSLLPPRPLPQHGALLLQALLAVAMVWLEPRTGTSPVLLVLVVAQAAMRWQPPQVLALMLALNAAMYAVFVQAHMPRPLLVVIIYTSFQAFAALTAHYARSAERARDALAYVNADLLATRALLADSARDAERLRLARELHDVAGHKLTAMRINLRLLGADPALARRDEVAVVEQLSAELLSDIRNVVQSLRDDQGLDLQTALRALAAPFPRPALRLQIDPAVRITDARVAELLLRLVQEALTNAVRHADANEVAVHLQCVGAQLQVDICDDGRRAERIREGNGITGMRERLAALHGQLELGRTPTGGMHLIARLPA
ncbi:sensor histidine kinase [Xanthomonas arboricola pv. juglandis]|uniref:sensor histidine kinase n=1 Tax=Xanthomonas arboricola TaxID=56448 RepID=UPI0002FC960A|nr:sensor histidine kinase [Xanthomonas arboricola]MDN0220112.1 sensor histidine kinase [Xanthomonas arboricola pv. juglandis]MDN0224663.1 sensor histidine kinase [Xanthomonas arboricola pv. juglandis]MDN0228739.1 sensor histidine kinase [Xanthomonas arboricola pv. juglandis]MDN0231934.1 sensor histidine kinase [Xanthomonas arboricola pv. juglandis]MDN0236509.1 sensor histidine kinase [Xanthomonas arboricola pv. juglandis]